MDSASKQPGQDARAKWMMALAVLVLAAVLGAMALLQEHAADDAQARKNPTALAFERTPERWLAQPKEASDF
jgi:cell division protease FtsH